MLIASRRQWCQKLALRIHLALPQEARHCIGYGDPVDGVCRQHHRKRHCHRPIPGRVAQGSAADLPTWGHVLLCPVQARRRDLVAIAFAQVIQDYIARACRIGYLNRVGGRDQPSAAPVDFHRLV